MYAQAAIKPNTLLRNGAYGIVMRGVQKCTDEICVNKVVESIYQHANHCWDAHC